MKELENRLTVVLKDITDWLKFAEAKNLALITFKIKHLMIKVAYYKSDYNVFYEDEGSIRLYPQFGIYGEPKIFDSIDSFDINGLFNEYIT